MRNVVVAGVGMTPFRRAPGWGIRSMAIEASEEAVKDAGIDPGSVEKIYFGNAAAPTVTQQDMIRGQVAFRQSDFAQFPVINVENACASGSSAFHLGYQAVAGGMSEVVLVVGAEQLTNEVKERSFRALRGATDIYEIGESGPDEDWTSSMLMKFYAEEGQEFLDRTEATVEDLARVAVKNRHHASMNPLAQFRREQTIEEVLSARVIADPLTLPMCSPMTDGGAAAILCSEEYARDRLSGPMLLVRGSELRGGQVGSCVEDAAGRVFERSGVDPADLDLVELHDAAAPAELIQYGQIGLCAPGDEYTMIRSGATALGGRIPVNTSGGLMSRGHAIGATGIAQLYELATQLRGRAGARQVPGARLALAMNTGGWMSGDYAVAVATVLEYVG
ncbi:thiolase family protein [Nakamurella sp. YIM 132087]|uniref:Thiolase family protein n=1 Tax=Nakamurella alba TaxID=2665158 RepID=A0A7K1FSK5_9ACTN|nr:thiolase family protein [Nakamurella alba]MTD17098.1 thiolase family protein [Nakamurella alba]